MVLFLVMKAVLHLFHVENFFPFVYLRYYCDFSLVETKTKEKPNIGFHKHAVFLIYLPVFRIVIEVFKKKPKTSTKQECLSLKKRLFCSWANVKYYKEKYCRVFNLLSCQE